MSDIDPFGNPIPDTGLAPRPRDAAAGAGAPDGTTPPAAPADAGVQPASANAGAATAPHADAAPTAAMKEIEQRVIGVLKETYDPEIPVNIYDLGMIYNVDVKPDHQVHVRMTLTSPMCPVAGSLPGEVETRIRGVDGVKAATVELVWDPPWEKDMITEAGKLVLNIY